MSGRPRLSAHVDIRGQHTHERIAAPRYTSLIRNPELRDIRVLRRVSVAMLLQPLHEATLCMTSRFIPTRMLHECSGAPQREAPPPPRA